MSQFRDVIGRREVVDVDPVRRGAGRLRADLIPVSKGAPGNPLTLCMQRDNKDE